MVSGLVPDQPVTFVLTAETVVSGTQARVIGPLTFTADGTNLNEVSYYELPNNTFGGANIPVAQAPVPVAFINVHVVPGQNVILRPTACWIATNEIFPKVDVLFKLWRGAPITGTLIASADDSGDVERGAVTTFSHVDTGFTSEQTVTYVLTVEAPDPGRTANIVGALIITGSVQTLSAFFKLPLLLLQLLLSLKHKAVMPKHLKKHGYAVFFLPSFLSTLMKTVPSIDKRIYHTMKVLSNSNRNETL